MNKVILKVWKIVSLLFVLSNALDLFAQDDPGGMIRAFLKKDDNVISKPDYFIIRFDHRPEGDLYITRRLDDKTAIVSAEQLDLFPSSAISLISAANDDWKLSSPGLLKRIKSYPQKIIIAGRKLEMVISLLKSKFSHLPILYIDTAAQAVLIRAGKKDAGLLLNDPTITFIDMQPGPSAEISIIGYDPAFHGINAVTSLIPDANGRNIVAGVKEQKMQPGDLDLYKRILPSTIEATEISNHATVISSIIGGAGNSFYDGLGIANDCRFFPSSFSNLFADDVNALKGAKVSVQNHSYGTIIQQFYGAEAVSYDAQAFSADILHIFSAGNQGNAAPVEGAYAGISGYANLTGNFKMAKNIITVGAIDNKGNISPESSSGPLYDGRLAPQLTALGPNGTSDAAAMVTGTAAVLQQIFADSNHQQLPPSILVRSVLYTSSDDVYKTGIDYKTGYGLLNSYKAVRLLQQKKYFVSVLAKGEEWNKNITIPSGASQIRLTLTWNDPPAALNNNKALIDDLDLELLELSTGKIYYPWVLNGYPRKDSLDQLPVRRRDSLNTSEQISIQLPNAGNWQINVRSFNAQTPVTSFAVTYWIDTLHSFRFTNPLGSADLARDESDAMTIRWTATVIDSTETGDLFISYNDGVDWNRIGSSLKLSEGLFHCPKPATSSIARLKMVTASGEHLSGNFIISDLTRPFPDFVCTDSFRLSWNKHIYATSYDVYSLTDSSHMKVTLNTADTFAVLDRKKYPSLVYAVQPVLSNHLPAARSVAFNIELQGVQCFFKTLNYTLEDNNQLKMILELSAAFYADSIYFEEVTREGILLSLFDSQAVISGKSVYSTIAERIAAGNIYIRARIHLKRGAVVYTGIVPVFSSGPKNVLFYPNPVRRSEPLMYMMKQGISPDCRLQIYDAYGVLIKDHASMPRTIDISLFMRGMYFFKLTDNLGKLISTEKIIVP